MRILPVASCSLATLAVWNLNQSANATPNSELLTQSIPETTEDIVREDENPTTHTVDSIAPPEVINNSPSGAELQNFQQETIIAQNSISDSTPAIAENAAVAVENLTVKTVKAIASPEEKQIPPLWSEKNPDSTVRENLPIKISAQTNNQPENSDNSTDGLGEIEIINRPGPARQPDVQLQLRSSVFSNSTTAPFVNSALLLATPKLGPRTRLVATAGGGVISGGRDYSFFNFGVGVRQQVARGTYVKLQGIQERLYEAGSNDNLVDNSVRLAVEREDQLAKKLRLDSFYEVRGSFAEQSAFVYDQSRIANTLGARLRYDITPQLEGSLDYQVVADSFTQASFANTTLIRQQLSVQATYRLHRNAFVSTSASYVHGSILNPFDGPIKLNNLVLGVNVGLNL